MSGAQVKTYLDRDPTCMASISTDLPPPGTMIIVIKPDRSDELMNHEWIAAVRRANEWR